MSAACRDRQYPEILIATLGVEPQVVTITLDQLLAGGRTVGELVVVYTENPAVQKAMDTVADEFADGYYPGIQLRPVPVTSGAQKIRDFCNDADLGALLRTLYGEVRRARQQRFTVHLCVSGGRKVMGIIAMVVAQLLFGPEDCAWHLVTEGWQPGDRRRLHLPAGEKVWLVPIPVLRWQEAGTLVQTVTELDDPAEVVAWYEKLTRDEYTRRKGEFIRRWLTPAEREVVELVCQGLDNKAIAARLYKKEQTVANQLRSVYEKLREWLGHPAATVERSVLIAEFSSYLHSDTFSPPGSPSRT